ncbi:hypothetical protein CEP54_016031 [Fusarium duplospermum]|uniref:EKC/KEOPS complex subunit BUD32 n=1 Tax=Fusarium duplospermum TaxID=1325734 RepID=A0A428NIX7_9HYPO|nr:hypothetical protein CEP54_016031 [Fusarium duplospermum]
MSFDRLIQFRAKEGIERYGDIKSEIPASELESKTVQLVSSSIASRFKLFDEKNDLVKMSYCPVTMPYTLRGTLLTQVGKGLVTRAGTEVFNCNGKIMSPGLSAARIITCSRRSSRSVMPSIVPKKDASLGFEMAADDIQYPSGFGLQDVVGSGTTGLVVLDKPTSTVVKTPLDHENELLIAREKQVYERFAEKGGHKGLLGYYGTFESGIRLQHASNYHLRSANKKDLVSENQRLSWVIQIAEAMDFIHKAGVIHGDLTCANIFLDEELNAKLADFAGSSIDGSPLLVAVPASHEYPGSLLSIQGDLFAFGCVLYEIMTQQIPHDGKTDSEIRGLYTRGVFPDTSSLGALGRISR